MKKLLIFITICILITSNGYYAQVSERQEMHEKFQTYIEEEQLERKFKEYKKVKPKDDKYQKVLKERIKLGFILDDTKQLRKDMNALHTLSLSTSEIIQLFKPERFPPSEWERFYATTKTLKAKTIKDTSALIFVTSLQGNLSLLLLEDETTLNALQELETLVSDSLFYGSFFLDHYINALLDNEKIEEAEEILVSNYKKFESEHLLNRLIALYYEEKEYDKIIAHSSAIKAANNVSLYHLALSYEQINKEEEMLDAFENYARLFQFENDAYVYIKKGSSNYLVPPKHLEKIGDIYFTLEPKAACKYYKMGINDSPSSSLLMLEKFKIAVSDQEKLDQFKTKLEEEDQKKAATQERIQKKLEKCNE
jgi:hypothetical protein